MDYVEYYMKTFSYLWKAHFTIFVIFYKINFEMGIGYLDQVYSSFLVIKRSLLVESKVF